MEYSTYAAMAAGGGEIDPELCRLYKLLNKDAQATNQEKKQKIVDKMSKKGIQMETQEVNLLKMTNDAVYDDLSSSSNDDEEDRDIIGAE
jgi:hypothetical protein